MKVKESIRTRQCRTRKKVFTILHFLCLFGPLLYFIPYGYITGELVSKVGMSFTIVVSIMLAGISMLASVAHRSGLHRCILWILIIGVLVCLTEVKTFIWIMAVTSILDELVFVRVKDYYKAALLSNREIDRRQ